MERPSSSSPTAVVVALQWWNNSGTPGFFGDDILEYRGTATQRC